MSNKSAVLVHGRHLGTRGWEEVVWGKAPDALGQVPKAILVALELGASLMIFSTGASERDGKKEGEYTLDYARERLSELSAFDAFRENWNEAYTREFLERVARLELASMNTRDELRNSGRICLAEGVTRFALVSCPSHLPRIIRDASIVYADPEFAALRNHYMVIPSDVPYQGTTPEDVVIIEPPHRGDHVGPSLHRHAARLLRVPAGERAAFLDDLDTLLQRHGA